MVSSLSDPVPVIAAITAALIALVGSVFYNFRRSRCDTIDCCGVAKCHRQLMTAEEMAADPMTGQLPEIPGAL
jgi:hypothetical protein